MLNQEPESILISILVSKTEPLISVDLACLPPMDHQAWQWEAERTGGCTKQWENH